VHTLIANQDPEMEIGGCPMCREEITGSEENKTLETEILKSAVRCPNEDMGCKVNMSLNARFDHIHGECQFVPRVCLTCDKRCSTNELHTEQNCIAILRAQRDVSRIEDRTQEKLARKYQEAKEKIEAKMENILEGVRLLEGDNRELDHENINLMRHRNRSIQIAVDYEQRLIDAQQEIEAFEMANVALQRSLNKKRMIIEDEDEIPAVIPSPLRRPPILIRARLLAEEIKRYDRGIEVTIRTPEVSPIQTPQNSPALPRTPRFSPFTPVEQRSRSPRSPRLPRIARQLFASPEVLNIEADDDPNRNNVWQLLMAAEPLEVIDITDDDFDII